LKNQNQAPTDEARMSAREHVDLGVAVQEEALPLLPHLKAEMGLLGGGEEVSLTDPDRDHRLELGVVLALAQLGAVDPGPAPQHALGEGRVVPALHLDLINPTKLILSADVEDQTTLALVDVRGERVQHRGFHDGDGPGQDGVQEVDEHGLVLGVAEELVDHDVHAGVDAQRLGEAEVHGLKIAPRWGLDILLRRCRGRSRMALLARVADGDRGALGSGLRLERLSDRPQAGPPTA
jgi:hypothetical protein